MATVLLLEQNAVLRTLLAEWLGAHGYTVLPTQTIREALAICAAQPQQIDRWLQTFAPFALAFPPSARPLNAASQRQGSCSSPAMTTNRCARGTGNSRWMPSSCKSLSVSRFLLAPSQHNLSRSMQPQEHRNDCPSPADLQPQDQGAAMGMVEKPARVRAE